MNSPGCRVPAARLQAPRATSGSSRPMRKSALRHAPASRVASPGSTRLPRAARATGRRSTTQRPRCGASPAGSATPRQGPRGHRRLRRHLGSPGRRVRAAPPLEAEETTTSSVLTSWSVEGGALRSRAASLTSMGRRTGASCTRRASAAPRQWPATPATCATRSPLLAPLQLPPRRPRPQCAARPWPPPHPPRRP